MTNIRHLSNAPITEAVIDFRVRFPPEFNPKQLLLLREKLHENFPIIEERNLFEYKFGVAEGESISSSTEIKGLHGLFCKSGDGLDILQCQIDGFAYSRLKPYEDWKHLVGKCRQFWEIFRTTVKPEIVSRIATRYINRIDAQTAGLDQYADLFTTPLPFPENESKKLSTFLTRAVFEDDVRSANINVIHAFDRKSFFLDIDAFKSRDYASNDDEIWSALDDLHDIKNEIFFSSISDNAARRFQ